MSFHKGLTVAGAWHRFQYGPRKGAQERQGGCFCRGRDGHAGCAEQLPELQAHLLRVEILGEYPAEMKESLSRLSDIIRQLSDIYGEQINISFINAQSFAGIYRSLVHRTRTYPAFIIEKTDVYAGLELTEIRRIIDTYLMQDEPRAT